jgi:heme-degrading monooxygenase HmoA
MRLPKYRVLTYQTGLLELYDDDTNCVVCVYDIEADFIAWTHSRWTLEITRYAIHKYLNDNTIANKRV